MKKSIFISLIILACLPSCKLANFVNANKDAIQVSNLRKDSSQTVSFDFKLHPLPNCPVHLTNVRMVGDDVVGTCSVDSAQTYLQRLVTKISKK